jgi:acyl carrier protein
MNIVCTSLSAALSRHLGTTDVVPFTAQLEEDLGLDPLDLTLIALRLEEEELREFPLASLVGAKTVSDLDDVVRAWLIH